MTASVANLTKSAVIRKGSALLRQVPRRRRRIFAKSDDYRQCPPVLVNSLPKSGTHLLLQIARALPQTHYFGSFIAQRPSTSVRLRSQSEVDRLIDRVPPGEVIPAHLHFSPQTAEALRQKNILHLFIHRDPAAVVLSEAAYLSDMARWNALHARFAALPDMRDRIDLAIDGDGSPEYPDAANRFAPFLEWSAQPDVISLRYEDLMSPQTRTAELHRIAEAYVSRTDGRPAEDLMTCMEHAIAPEKSHTYRNKDCPTDRQELSEKQRARLREMFLRLHNDA